MSDDDRRAKDIEQLKSEALANLGLSARTVNTLEQAGLFTIGQLSGMTRDDLLSLSNFGETSIAECRRLLDSLKIPHPFWKRPPKRRK